MKRVLTLAASLALMFTAGFSPAAVITKIDISSWLPAQQESNSADGSRGSGTRTGDHWRSDSPFTSTEINYDGEIRVSDDDRSIKSISPGGYLKISIRTFGNSRELLISSDSRANLSYEFQEGRKEIPYEPEGRRWLEEVLPDVIRSSGIDAEGRTARIYSKGGVDAVLDEISRIPSNKVMAMYFSALLDDRQLSDRELTDIVYAIAGKMSSSSGKGMLFRKYRDTLLRNPKVATAYFGAIPKISSSSEQGRIYRNIDRALDFSDPEMAEAYFAGIDRISSSSETGSVLRHAINTQQLPVHARALLLKSAAKISSSTESGRVLRTLGDLDFNNAEIREAFFGAVDHLSSSSEAGSVLRDVLRKNEIAGASMVAFLSSARKISSSAETGSVIRTISGIDLDEPSVREAYFNVIRTNSSSSESGRMLRYTLENHKLGQESLINLYETTGRVSSSTEIGSVLRTSIPYLIYEEPVLDAFFSCTARISSSSEQGRVLRNLSAADKLNRHAVKGIMVCARRISSSTEKGSVLRAVAPKVKEGDRELRDIYMETAKTLSSDSEYRRAVDAIM